MSTRYPGGLITKTPVVPTVVSAPGVWTLEQALAYIKAGTWPFLGAIDPYFNQTTLLLHGDGNQGAANFYNSGSPRYLAFTDNSSNNFPITVNGDAYGTTVSPYQGNYSNFFDGTGDWLSVADNAAFALGSGNFTVEAWVFNGVTGARQIICGQFDSGGTVSSISLYLEKTAANKLLGGVASGSTLYTVTSTSDLPLNQWVHVALVRNGNTGTLYINGTADGTVSLTGVTVNDSSNSFSVGRGGDFNGLYFTGYISNFRLVKGTAVYTSNFTPPTTPLTAISGTSLLTCQSNRFIDNSSNNFAITRNGDTLISPFQPFTLAANDNGSGYFDGTGDFLSVPDNAALQFGTGNFTIQAWIYRTVSGAQQAIVSKGSSTTGWQFQISSSNALSFINGTTTVDTVTTVPLNAWTHVAVVREGTGGDQTKMYINGVAQGFLTVSTSFTQTNSLIIGANRTTSTALFSGYISDLRIVKGTAVYTSTFTPPTAPVANITNTSLLTCQYSGTVNNTGFIDSGPYYFPITRFGNTTQGTFSPFSLAAGQWSNYFDGNGSYLSVANNAAFQFGTGNFTVEFWVYANSSTTTHGLVAASLTGSGYWASLIFSGLIYWQSQNGATNLLSFSYSGYYDKWTHVAFVRNSGTTKLYLDGVERASASDSTNYNGSSGNYDIGRDQDNTALLTGYLSNVRVVKGTAVYTSNFTPPTTPLTAITNTSLLTCQSNRFVDNSTNNFAITRTGAVRVTPFSPFAPSAAYSPSVNGGSGYFDGTGDYINVNTAGNSAFNFGPGIFTIEMFVYHNQLKNYSGLIGDPNTIALYTYTSGAVGVNLLFGSGQAMASSSGVALANTWQHYAIVRNGTVTTLYVDGISRATFSSSGVMQLGETAGFRVGSVNTWGDLNGYISNVRILKGVAQYTANFTPPTAPLTPVANTSLLLNFTSAGIFDQTGENALETLGNAQVDTSVVKYGIGSMKFDGAGDSLFIPTSENFAFGTGNFTIEMWVYPVSASNVPYIIDCRSTTSASEQVPTIYIDSNQTLRYWVSGNIRITSNTTLTLNTWSFIAIVRIGTTTTMYINGVSAGSFTDSYNYISTAMRIGRRTDDNSQFLNGYIDDLRITKGVARYNTNFTPPTRAFPNQ
jgi:hypothetical protein